MSIQWTFFYLYLDETIQNTYNICMKTYIQSIQSVQKITMVLVVLTLMIQPIMVAYFPNIITSSVQTLLYDISHILVFLVMAIRPLADLLPRATWLRPLIFLRKSFGALSAAIVIAFVLAKVLLFGFGYLLNYFTPEFWALENNFYLAHLADVTGLLLLITSNDYSKRLLKKNWKRIQRLAYVYFYASGLYVYLQFGKFSVLAFMIIVSILWVSAELHNRSQRKQKQPIA